MKGLIITQILNRNGSEHFTSKGQAFFLKYSSSSHLSLSPICIHLLPSFLILSPFSCQWRAVGLLKPLKLSR